MILHLHGGHGGAGNGRDLVGSLIGQTVWPLRHQYPFIVIFPQAKTYQYDPQCGLPEELDRSFIRESLNVPDEERCCRLQPFRLLKPPSVKWGQRYPLVLHLHGSGERGRDNCRQLSLVPRRFLMTSWRERYPCYVLAPQCPPPLAWPYPAEGPQGERIDPLGDVMALVDQVCKHHAVNPS